MASFITELWETVFQPGTSPALITATHASFCLLVISLVVLIFYSGSIHFFNLLVIALLLWGSVTWFIAELEKEKAKLKTNEELQEQEGVKRDVKEGDAEDTKKDK
ncbi:unnamed protein product [Kuraishia capsulata CBS 1993]|uniref:Uncharacterized protein n=1 Tax=Kuraishia capsulata CBS 1993 TaxID=1382522 RepID=W6MHA2_9ASCO|nr:uncharacterized protein KUCA_T00001569001 [Kuraishia capsulata CBS 1993]CDK25599.1 unnamed protein product [Kuraishia capsulata CBS 1993]